jgi:hypothetical protein
MTLHVIGAGLGRTGTTSLRDALGVLLGGRCYHFEQVIADPSQVDLWNLALAGQIRDWDAIFQGYVATTDWPAAAYWRDLAGFYPQAFVLLSTRATSAEWFDSVKGTIEPLMTRRSSEPEDGWHMMSAELLRQRFMPPPFDRRRAIQAYEDHNEAVRRTVPPHRLIEWTPGDGWGPLCAALGLPVPEVPFPHLNTRTEFRESLTRWQRADPQGRSIGGLRLPDRIRSKVRP